MSNIMDNSLTSARDNDFSDHADNSKKRNQSLHQTRTTNPQTHRFESSWLSLNETRPPR